MRAEKKRGEAAAGKAQFLVPINNFLGECPVYVNAKQYDAILRRRMKKIRRQGSAPPATPQGRVRYEKRSLHAKRRVRMKDGKFATKDKKDESTVDSALAQSSLGA